MFKKIILFLLFAAGIVLIQGQAFATEQYNTNFYINNLRKKVEVNWVVPLESKDKSTVLSFSVNPDGSVSDVSILRSSGDDKFDKSALDAIYKAIPFEHLANSKENINVQFFFSPAFTSAIPVSNKNQSNIVNISNKNVYIDFTDYTNNLQDKINANWNPKNLKKERMAIASIRISKDGSLDNFTILKSSRSKKFDRGVLDSITNSVPMAPFPDQINAPFTDIQLVFKSDRGKAPKGIGIAHTHYVDAGVKNVVGYDAYTQQVEKVLSNSLKDKRYYLHKDLIVELKINKEGKLKYVKVKKPSKDKNFDRKILAILQKTSFPPVPETIPFNDVTLNYEILTQRGHSLHDFIFDYLIFGGTTRLKSFGLTEY